VQSRLKTLVKTIDQPENKPVLRAVVPLFAMNRRLAIGAFSEKLYLSLCDHCRNPLRKVELLAFNGNVCLLGCDKVGCAKKLFRIDTA
jgi:hypothetical protein